MPVDITKLFAHTPAKGANSFHLLEDHLLSVAALASSFAAKFEIAPIGYALGLAHDLAKADPKFQSYLEACLQGKPAEKCPHAVPSAKAVRDVLGPFVLPIIGHHTGMPDQSEAKGKLENANSGSTEHGVRMLENLPVMPDLRAATPEWSQDRLACEMLIRMAFSTLVDADYLDTEKHFDHGKSGLRRTYPKLTEYRQKLADHLAAFNNETGQVNEIRADILASCIAMAQEERGAFRLTVPTGGGKTLSSVAFALDHASHNEMDRVIMAIPFTSIIDQTAETYAGIFGRESILEHHSGVDVDDSDESQRGKDVQRRLAAENWDCPLVVTTTVQLFESLLSNKPSQCRKLHNIAKSVIILDEVQALPPHTLGPILDVLNELVLHYACSVVFCTATQPDYSNVDQRLYTNAIEIVPDFPEHFQKLKRVAVDVRDETWGNERIVQEIHDHDQILVVFNTRKDAVEIARQCGEIQGLLHLSTLMCGHHRKKVIKEVKQALSQKIPIRLISTQVIEAGVDVDFPVVMRDMGPLDRIVQTAGRCNREGKMATLGRCVVFKLEGGRSPMGAYRTATAISESLLDQYRDDPISPEVMRSFTREYFRMVETGSTEGGNNLAAIQKLRQTWAFATVANTFKLIDQNTEPLIIERYPYFDVEKLLADSEWNPSGWFRRISPFTVAVYEHEARSLKRDGHLREHASGVWIYSGPYDKILGLSPDLTDTADLVQ